MSKFVTVSVLVVGAAILLGYAGGAVMATEIGRASLAGAAALIALIGVLESGNMSAPSHRG